MSVINLNCEMDLSVYLNVSIFVLPTNANKMPIENRVQQNITQHWNWGQHKLPC